MDAQKILGAGFQKTYDTKLVIHGFSNNLQSEMVQGIARGEF